MGCYQWSGWGILPVALKPAELASTLSQQPWQHWTEDLSDNEIKDIRRFYTRSSANVFRPLKDGRYSLDIAATDMGHIKTTIEGVEVVLSKIQLITLDEIAICYLHMVTEKEIAKTCVSKVNRGAFQWQPRTQYHQVTQWCDQHGNEACLTEWMSDLLHTVIDGDKSYGEDAFGHELASCSWVRRTEKDGDEGICVSELSAGIKLNDPGYVLAQQEYQRLYSNQFSVWKDWRCQYNRGRLVFVEDSCECSTLQANLSQFSYYLDLFAMVIYQKIMLTYFKDELVLGEESTRNLLYTRIASFRRKYKVSHMSTYPFAEELYQYLHRQAGIEKLEEKAFIELEHSYALWKKESEDINSRVIYFISLIAALLVPTSSVATIFALNEKQMSLGFWIASSLLTGVTFVVILWPLVRKLLRKK